MPSLPVMVTGVWVVIGIEVIVEVIEQVGLGVQLVEESEGVDQTSLNLTHPSNPPKIHMALLKTREAYLSRPPQGALVWVQVIPSTDDHMAPAPITHSWLLKTREFEIHCCPLQEVEPA